MPEADDLLRVARQWLQKAENDLKNATYTLYPLSWGLRTDSAVRDAESRQDSPSSA